MLIPCTQGVAPCESVAQWWPAHRTLATSSPSPVELAIAGGFAADRVGWAFASGYQAALRALVPGLPDDRIAAFCVTEEGGNTPKAIRTTLRRSGEHFVLEGAKRWTTLGPQGALLVVAARDADVAGERPALRLVRVPSDAAGVEVSLMRPTRFVPEVPHAQLRFSAVALAPDALLPGDGYDEYVKPFRTVEDIHVQAAVIAYLLAEGMRRGWPESWRERMAALLAALTHLATLSPRAAQTHLALAGALAVGGTLIAEADELWKTAGADSAAARWARDRELLQVAGKAREARTRRAWENLSLQHPRRP